MRKKFLLLITTACLSIGGILSFAFLNRKSESSKLSADNSAIFTADFSTRVEIDENIAEYKMLKQGNPNISVTVRAIGTSSTASGMGNSSSYYFYNTDPFRGMSATAIQFQSSSSYYIASYLSDNPIKIEDIYAGKYQDLFSWIGYKSGSDYLSINSTEMPSLLNYRYVLVQVIPMHDQEVDINMIGVMTPCEGEPEEVPVGTNTGVLSETVKSFLSAKSYGCTTIPNQVGNGAYFVDPSGSYFNFVNIVAHNGENAFLNNLTIGFSKTFDKVVYDRHQLIYQKNIDTKTHSFVVYVYASEYGDVYEYQYTDEIGYINSSSTWPTETINGIIAEKYQSLIIPFTDSLIEEYLTTEENYNFDKEVSVVIYLSDGHSVNELKTKLHDLRQSYVNEGMRLDEDYDFDGYFNYRLVYDNGFFGVSISGDTAYNQIVITFGNNEAKAFPTRTDIATKLQLSSHTDKIVLFGGSGRFVWGNESGSVVPYGATVMNIKGYDISYNDIVTFAEQLNAAGYENTDSEIESYYVRYVFTCKIGDLYGSYLKITIIHYLEENRTAFAYYYYDLQKYVSEASSYVDMMSHIGFKEESPFVNEAILPSEATYKYINASIEGIVNKGFVYGAGAEFVNSLTSIEGLIYDYITDSYRVAGSNQALKIKQEEGLVVLEYVYRDYFNNYSQPYTTFNDFVDLIVDNYSLPTANAIHIDESDNIPAYFQISSSTKAIYLGTEQKVDELKTLLSDKLEDNTLFTYSEYLDAYVNEAGLTYTFTKQKSSNYPNVYTLMITITTGQVYKDYDSYNNLGLGSMEKLSLYPDIISNKDLKAFVIDSYNEFGLVLSTNQDFTTYEQSLTSYGFVKINNTYYMSVDPSTGFAYAFLLEITGTNRQRLTFAQNGQYFDSSYLDEEGHETVKAFFANFDVPTCFTSTSKIYNYSVNESEHYLAVFNNATEVNNYKDYLLAHGYKYYSGDNYYLKTSSDGCTAYGVTFKDYGGLIQIQFNLQEMPFVSHSEMLNALKADSSYDINSAHLVYPVDDGQNHFYVSYVNSRNTTIMLNKNYDVSAYETAIMSFEEYQTKESGTSSGLSFERYILANGIITIINVLDLYYRVELYCSYVDPVGRDFDHAIAVSLGENAITIDGSLKYYVITIPESGYYAFQTTGTSGLDTVGVLYNSGRSQIDSNDDSYYGEGYHFYILHELKEDDVVYVGVRTYGKTDASTTLKITKIELPDPETATPISRGTTLLTLTKDSQFYKYTPTFSGTYYFEFAGDYSVTIIIYDEDLDDVYYTQDVNSATVSLNAGQTYVIELKLYRNVEVSSAPITLSLDADLPTENPTALNVGETTI